MISATYLPPNLSKKPLLEVVDVIFILSRLLRLEVNGYGFWSTRKTKKEASGESESLLQTLDEISKPDSIS
jgi:hypothetical protein